MSVAILCLRLAPPVTCVDKCNQWRHRCVGHSAKKQLLLVLNFESHTSYRVCTEKNEIRCRTLLRIQFQCSLWQFRLRQRGTFQFSGQVVQEEARPDSRTRLRVRRRAGGEDGVALEYPRYFSRCFSYGFQQQGKGVLAFNEGRSFLPEDGGDLLRDVPSLRLEDCAFHLRRWQGGKELLLHLRGRPQHPALGRLQNRHLWNSPQRLQSGYRGDHKVHLWKRRFVLHKFLKLRVTLMFLTWKFNGSWQQMSVTSRTQFVLIWVRSALMGHQWFCGQIWCLILICRCASLLN